MPTADKIKVVILGGGFAGFYAALFFENKLKHRNDIEVTVVDKENFFLFTPMLHEVAAGDLSPQAIVYPLRKIFRRTAYFKGEIDSIDLNNQLIHLVYGDDNEQSMQLNYDQLLVAVGSVTNFFDLEGLKESALTMKSLGDAVFLRNQLISKMEEADIEEFTHKRKTKLTFVVAGGGFAGVETIAAINDFVRESVKYYPHLNDDLVRIVLVHAGPTLLPEFSSDLGAYTARKLEERKIEIMTNTGVKAFKGGLVELSKGDPIECDTLIWTAGVTPSPAIERLTVKKQHGHVIVNEYLQSPDYANVWCAGDCAFITDAKTGKPYPPTAQHALREGRVAAENILAAIDKRPPQPFSYSSLGQMAAIGRRTGVANILGMKVSGFLGWALWRTIYLAKLPGLDRQFRVGFQWLLDLFFPPDLAQYLSTRGQVLDRATALRPHSAGGTVPFEEQHVTLSHAGD